MVPPIPGHEISVLKGRVTSTSRYICPEDPPPQSVGQDRCDPPMLQVQNWDATAVMLGGFMASVRAAFCMPVKSP